jgi:hypothetical protein
MKARVSELLQEIRQREEELEEALRSHEVEFFYRLDGTKVKFERKVRETHRRLKVGIFRWLRQSSFRNTVSAPVIYAMIIPFALLDLMISAYQLICFPLYRIPRVSRQKFIVIDRHRLSYMNGIERLNCVYCGYVGGLIAYSREIVARTEQYWCPVKHARKILDPHRRYARFADYGDSEDFQEHIARLRTEIRAEASTSSPG